MGEFRFTCASCHQVHEGMPTFGMKYPLEYFAIPEADRDARASLGSDDCVIDQKQFFVRGCLEIPVQGLSDPFIWGAWVSLSECDFDTYCEYFGVAKRSHIGPFMGSLAVDIGVYPVSTHGLKTRVHLRDGGIRPFLELAKSNHPLSKEQADGISQERLAYIYEATMHPRRDA